jgi:ASC-1-like (ASCH) protein/GNAT superfamily N-acetyltransferase
MEAKITDVINIREARKEDYNFVIELMDTALGPYYGGDHQAHGNRIFSTHISGGKDQIGHFSFEQKMFILTLNDVPIGMIHLVGKRQGTYKISPIILSPSYRGKSGFGTMLLEFAEKYARENNARQIYCTVAEQNDLALQFFIRQGYVVAGRSDSHYKLGITEVMLYKLLVGSDFEEKFDRPNISVLPCDESYEPQIRELLLTELPKNFDGINSHWVDALFNGYNRRHSLDINMKYKLIYVAADRRNEVLGVAGATPKKGEPIKIMPFIAKTLPAFVALLTDIPYELKAYGHKLYIHITPSVEETIALQQKGWKLNAAMPAAYHQDRVTQQWSIDISGDNFMRQMRVKQNFLDFIRKGEKTLEVRVGYSNIKTIRPGESIRFASRTQEHVVRVRYIRQYSTFDEMLKIEESNRIAPGLPKQDVLQLLREIYPPDRERLGVFVLDIKNEE